MIYWQWSVATLSRDGSRRIFMQNHNFRLTLRFPNDSVFVTAFLNPG